MFDVGAQTVALPFEEKMKYEQGDEGMSFGCVLPHPRKHGVMISD